MKAYWTIEGNHLALKDGKTIYHPAASDVYEIISNGGDAVSGIECSHPKEDLPGLRFSRIGASSYLRISNDESGDIFIQTFASRNGIEVTVDVIDGNVIDQCVKDNVWFYLSNGTSEIQEYLGAAGIMHNGKISMRQYFKLLEILLLDEHCSIINTVELKGVSRPSDNIDKVPSTLKATLFPYQESGFFWIKHMLDDCEGCILGDEMGLGKTMQVITEILYLKSKGNTPVLVVAPISLLANWKREIEKFAPSLSAHVHHGANRISNYKHFLTNDVVITAYSTVISDIHMLNMIQWQMVALDEAQNIKNPHSTRTKACKSLNRARSIAVSGTPFENHVSDIWSLLDFVQPRLFGSLSSYEKVISDDVEGGKRIEPVLSSLMIRRLVSDVAKDLPEKVISAQPLQMSEKECEEYNNYLSVLKNNYETDKIGLGMLQHLRIYCTHPFAANDIPDISDPAEVSVKYQRFCELVSEIVERGEKLIVFTSYKKMFEIFKKDVPMRFGIQLWTINGETPVDERQRIVDRFNSLSGSAMLVLNPRAAGTGLNITGANHVIHYNLEWNPSLEDQSSARAYRRGQKKTVFIYRLYYNDTIEQVVNERIERKRDIASNAVVGNDGISQDRADIIRALEMVPGINK